MALKNKSFFRKNGRAVVLAADHPYFGYIKGLETTYETLFPLVEFADALMIAPGTKKHYFPNLKRPIILRVSGCASVLDVQKSPFEQELARLVFENKTGKNFDKLMDQYSSRRNLSETEQAEYGKMQAMLIEEDTLAKERLIMSAKDAIDLGASAVAVSVYLGTKYEDQTLYNLVQMSQQASKLGIPTIGVVAVGKRLGRLEQDSDFLARAGRMLVEHGADIVKTYYCDNDFERIINCCPVPVVVAGGKMPKTGDQTKSTLEIAFNAIKRGASGLDFGRRIWQHPHPSSMIQALIEIVHNNANVKQAYEKFLSVAK